MYESDIEELTLEKLQAQEYEYIYGPTIAPDGEHPERQSWDDVILPGRFKHGLVRYLLAIPVLLPGKAEKM